MYASISLIATMALAATSVSAKTISISVGQSGLTYSPNSTTAAVGDELEFSFYPKAHNVVQGSFNTPCATGNITSGFYSGFVPTSSGESMTKFVVKVNDTKPIWYFCSQQSHCQGGMVGVINPPTTGANTLEAYTTASKATKNSTAPAAVQGGVLSMNGMSMNGSSNSNGTISAGERLGAVGGMSVALVVVASLLF